MRYEVNRMQKVQLKEAVTHLEELIDAAVNGETILIVRDDEHIVQLTPIASMKKQRKFGSAAGLIHLDPDFDAPLSDFEAYM
jgi:antitoxin (DNA-binding transcriptional repressor) of toxin-antitoxin stability system